MTEMRACRTIGRLPCMASSNLMADTLRGNDDVISFDDLFNGRKCGLDMFFALDRYGCVEFSFWIYQMSLVLTKLPLVSSFVIFLSCFIFKF